MSDFLLENEAARRMIKTLGLPLPMPTKLRRAKGPWEERPLHDETFIVGAAPGGALASVLARTLTAAGGSPVVTTSELHDAFAEAGEAYGRPPTRVAPDELPDGMKARGFVFDATGLREPSDLRTLYDFFHPLMYRLERSGRVVVLGRPPTVLENTHAAATQAALDGFVRSVAKEVGKKGSTAMLLYVEEGAEGRIEGPLRFALSARSAFVSGQPLTVSNRVRAPKRDLESWMRPLEGKVALVTGAARGIGAATAELLAAEGAHVVCLDRPQDDALCSQVARKIGGSVLLADVSSTEAPRDIASELRERHRGVDIVVHNAGVTRDKTLAKMKPEAWDQAVEINLSAVARINDALLEGVMHDDGRIICLSSVAGIAGNMGQTNYAASKAGIVGYVRRLAEVLADRGITVNAIAPGFIETRLTAAIPVVIREVGRRLSNLGQGGQPRDVGDAITFLASPGAVGLTGNVLRVCGGAFIGA
jgi:3-oxoacyl-[acyl-carrier protein] reductase